MAVRIRLKRMGRTHRPFYRVCAMDARSPRDGRVIEELGHYDPMVRETDARAVLNGERIDYWLTVGAQPSDKVKVLIRKYGLNGTHLEAQREALERLQVRPQAPPPVAVPLRKATQEEASAESTPAEETSEQTSEAAAEASSASSDE